MPVIVGNMDLLKVLKEWEVGIAIFKLLKKFSFTNIGFKLYSAQLDRMTKVEHLDLSHNKIERIPETIGRSTMLTYLDLSFNNLTSLPPELFLCPLQVCLFVCLFYFDSIKLHYTIFSCYT